MTIKPKLFFHVQHLLGIGHQMRAAAITRACLEAGFEVHYISGGFPEKLPDLGKAVFHQLPPVKTLDGDFNKLIDETGKLIDEAWWQKRREDLLSLYHSIKPDLVLLEGFPFARRKFKEELIPLLQQANQDKVSSATSLRDILVDPVKQTKRDFAFETARDYLDLVLVHGEENFCPLEKSFHGADCLKDIISYTGYVDSSAAAPATKDQSEIVISAGGGAAGAKLYLTALQAKQYCQDSKGVWRFMLGPNLAVDMRDQLFELSVHDPQIILEEARPDFRNLLKNSRLSISQAGYNTVMDILASGVESLVIPFADGGESEQSLRANLLADQGRLNLLSEDNLSAQKLAQKIDHLLLNPAQSTHTPFDLSGAKNTAHQLKRLLDEKA